MTISISSISFESIGCGKHDISITTPNGDVIDIGRIMRDYDGYFIYLFDDINGEEMTYEIDATGMHILTALKEAKKKTRQMLLDAAGQEEEAPFAEENEYAKFIEDAKELIEGEKVSSEFILPIMIESERLIRFFISTKSKGFDLDKFSVVMDLRFEIAKSQGLEIHESNEMSKKGTIPFSVQCRDSALRAEKEDNKEKKTMKHFIINIYCNKIQDWKRHGLKFEGDLKTVKLFSQSVARRIKCNDCTIYIYETNEYFKNEDCVSIIDIYNP